MTKRGMLIVLSGPSGVGKGTVRKAIFDQPGNDFQYSISMTTRKPRPGEVNGKDYFFVSKEEFEQKIRKGEFVEYEEVYAGSYYGTLQSEVERIWAKGHIILFDIDVKGGINIKRLYGRHALAVFIQPPSVEALKERLVKRGTDSPQAIERRVAKAEEELEYAKNFDRVIVNDSLECALREAEAVVETFYNE